LTRAIIDCAERGIARITVRLPGDEMIETEGAVQAAFDHVYALTMEGGGKKK
jgi:hypothetical protein